MAETHVTMAAIAMGVDTGTETPAPLTAVGKRTLKDAETMAVTLQQGAHPVLNTDEHHPAVEAKQSLLMSRGMSADPRAVNSNLVVGWKGSQMNSVGVSEQHWQLRRGGSMVVTVEDLIVTVIVAIYFELE